MFPHIGSKKGEIKQFEKWLTCKKVDIVVEPFGGSGAVVQYLHENYTGMKFHLNDLDPFVFGYYKLILGNQKDKEAFVERCKKILDMYKIPMTGPEGKEIMKDLKTKGQEGDYIRRKLTRNTDYTMSSIKEEFEKKKQTSLDSILHISLDPSLVRISCLDYKIVLEEYKDNSNALIFLDPPYLVDGGISHLNPGMYIKGGIDASDFINLRSFFKTCKCRVLFICLDNPFIAYVFRKFVRGTYEKVYSFTKKRVQHLIIANYTL